MQQQQQSFAVSSEASVYRRPILSPTAAVAAALHILYLRSQSPTLSCSASFSHNAFSTSSSQHQPKLQFVTSLCVTRINPSKCLASHPSASLSFSSAGKGEANETDKQGSTIRRQPVNAIARLASLPSYESVLLLHSSNTRSERAVLLPSSNRSIAEGIAHIVAVTTQSRRRTCRAFFVAGRP